MFTRNDLFVQTINKFCFERMCLYFCRTYFRNTHSMFTTVTGAPAISSFFSLQTHNKINIFILNKYKLFVTFWLTRKFKSLNRSCHHNASIECETDGSMDAAKTGVFKVDPFWASGQLYRHEPKNHLECNHNYLRKLFGKHRSA